MNAQINARWHKAEQLVSTGAVQPSNRPGWYLVKSQSGNGRYLVNPEAGTCTCPDQTSGQACKHVLATLMVVEMAQRVADHDEENRRDQEQERQAALFETAQVASPAAVDVKTVGKQFVTGGNATFTVENGKGQHYTFKVTRKEFSDGHLCYFAGLLTGPDNTGDYSYLGLVNQNTGAVKLTAKSRMSEDATPVQVLKWALGKVWSGQPLPAGYKIRHDGRCGCCGRKLTTPESLDRGIGPECWSRIAG